MISNGRDINATMANGIHSGAVIHHHDQYCTGPISASFNVKKMRKIITPSPNPPDVELSFFI